MIYNGGIGRYSVIGRYMLFFLSSCLKGQKYLNGYLNWFWNR